MTILRNAMGTAQQHAPEQQQRQRRDLRAAAAENKKMVADLLNSMSIEEKIGQMSQIELAVLLAKVESRDEYEKPYLDLDLVKHYVGELGIGSILNSPQTGIMSHRQLWNVTDYRNATSHIQRVAAEYKRPPVIWGIDSVHGANYVYGAIMTPQPISIAATFNHTVAYVAGQLASHDTRAAGINWLFSPLIGITMTGPSQQWSRLYETFGEDPHTVSVMAEAMVRGIQTPAVAGDDDNNSITPRRAAACGKHFIGYSAPHNSHDRAPSAIPTRQLYQYYVPPWQRVIGSMNGYGGGNSDNDDQRSQYSNVMSVMESYTGYDGVPNVVNPQSLNYLLRQRLQFRGVLVTDYQEMENAHGWHHVAPSPQTAVTMSLQQSSIDMSMIPFDTDNFANAIKAGVTNHVLAESRINDSVERVLRMKAQLGMFQDQQRQRQRQQQQREPVVGTASDEAAVLDMIHQSIVLTKNERRTLPLVTISSTTTPRTKLKTVITGPTAHSLPYQSGGWTYLWQGVPDNDNSWFSYGSTVYGAFDQHQDLDVVFRCGVDVMGQECQDRSSNGNEEGDNGDDEGVIGEAIDEVKDWIGGLGGGGNDEDATSIGRAVQASTSADVVVICVGEENYTEKPGDIRSMDLPQGQYELVRAISEKVRAQQQPDGKKTKIVLVYFGGRPRLLKEMVEQVDAVLVSFLPGPGAGEGIRNIVMGHANPSGKLPLTYPLIADGGGIPYFHTVSDQCTISYSPTTPLPHFVYGACNVQWNYGHGLSYSTFEYSDLSVSIEEGGGGDAAGDDDDLHVSVKVRNTGPRGGAETVFFFTFDTTRATTPEYKRLRAFDKVYLEPGEEREIKKIIPGRDLRYIGPHDATHYIRPDYSNAKMHVGVSPDADCRGDPDSRLCVAVQDERANRKREHQQQSDVPACEAACDLWLRQSGQCSHQFSSFSQCMDLCTSANHPTTMTAITGTQGWGWNYVYCLESVLWGMQQEQQQQQMRTTGSKRAASSSADAGDQCWKLTSLCRDVFGTEQLDQYGVGGGGGRGPHDHSHSLPHSSKVPPSNIVGLFVGLFTSIVIMYLMRGGTWRKFESRLCHRRGGT